MKKSFLAAMLVVSSSAAFAHGCPGEMKAVDAKMSAMTSISEADKAKAMQLRADGEAAHKSGKHSDSMKLLAEAKKVLGM
ncbi:hypothetical protein MOLA814_01712 [Betaproteobacteria bacterium MOLA814]|jgi:hypothetical protein|nr:hypothetical protein MOLA814_01712 [Betaproteobacteria bacterium MOLA814]